MLATNYWVEVSTKKENTKYYLNVSTFESRWKLPKDPNIQIVEGFAEIEDPNTHKYYYSNLKTGVSQWIKPLSYVIPNKYIRIPKGRRYESGEFSDSSVDNMSFIDRGNGSIDGNNLKNFSFRSPDIMQGSYRPKSYNLKNGNDFSDSTYDVSNDYINNASSHHYGNIPGSYYASSRFMNKEDNPGNHMSNTDLSSLEFVRNNNTRLDLMNDLHRLSLQQNSDEIEKTVSINTAKEFVEYSKTQLVYWTIKYDSKNVLYYENKITKEKTYIRPIGMDIPRSHSYINQKIETDLDIPQEDSYRVAVLKDKLADVTPSHTSEVHKSANNENPYKYLYQTEDISKTPHQFTVKRRVNIFNTQNLYLIVNAHSSKIMLNNKNIQVEEYSISTIKSVEIYKSNEDTAIITFKVPEGYTIYEAVKYKIPRPLILQFTSKRDRYIFMNLITYIKRYQNDLLIEKLQNEMTQEDCKNGILKWPIAELTYKGSFPLYMSLILPHSSVDSGRLRLETRQHIFYKEIQTENIKKVVKASSVDDGMASIFIILSDNTKLLLLFNDLKARDSFINYIRRYIY